MSAANGSFFHVFIGLLSQHKQLHLRMFYCVILVIIILPLLLSLHWILDGTHCSMASLLENTQKIVTVLQSGKKCVKRKGKAFLYEKTEKWTKVTKTWSQ